MVKREPGARLTETCCLKHDAEAAGLAWRSMQRALPKEMVLITGLSPNSGSSSECIPIESAPELYLLSRTELN